MADGDKPAEPSDAGSSNKKTAAPEWPDDYDLSDQPGQSDTEPPQPPEAHGQGATRKSESKKSEGKKMNEGSKREEAKAKAEQAKAEAKKRADEAKAKREQEKMEEDGDK